MIADIPLLGDLFRYDSVAEERRELLIILTPQIIYTKMDSDLVKQIESSRMSWILSDVINLDGEVGVRSRCDEWYDGEMESVYPTYIPKEGLLPLSPGQAAASCDTCVSGGSSSRATGPAIIEGEPIPSPTATPTPAAPTAPTIPNTSPAPARQSPSASARPTNDRYSAMGQPGVVQAAYYPQTAPQQLPAAAAP